MFPARSKDTALDEAPADKAPPQASLWPALRARPRLLGSAFVGFVAYCIARYLLDLTGASSILVGWNVGALLNLGLTWDMMRRTDIDAIKRRALTQDQGRLTILLVVVLASAAVLLAVATQLAQARELHGLLLAWHVGLAVLTLMTAWLFTQLVFALHYAHDFYIARNAKQADPLLFPGTKDPLYADFFYFACVIGTSAQTADIAFNGSALRPVGTLHCLLAFFFNASLLALSINVVAGVVA